MVPPHATSRIQDLARHLPHEHDGIRLRPLALRDAAGLSAGAADPQTMRWAYMPETDQTPEAMVALIDGQYREDAARGHAVRVAIADIDTDEYLGTMAFFDDQGDSAEVGFVLEPRSRGKRVAQRALAASEDISRQVGYLSLRARADVGNLAAQRTLEAAGYARSGPPQPPVSEGYEHVLLQPFSKPLTPAASQPAPSSEVVELQALLESLVSETGVPGAQATIIHRGVSHNAAAGVLSVRTGLGVTTEGIFQVGSITKLFTTVLVLQLVDDGLIKLEDPVSEHVAEFRLADTAHTAEVRIIDLLQHRGGFDGDYFTDGGRGSDAPRALIADLVTSQSFFRPGEQFAYSNAGMVLLGRLVELKRGTDYLRAVQQRLFEPLGLQHAVTLPEEAILHFAAVGHTRDDTGAAVVIPSWQLPMSAAATGAALTMSAENLARFGEMLAHDGRTREGVQILSPEMTRLMGEEAFELPIRSSVGDGFGVGAFTYRYDGALAFGHDGQTVGQVAGLRIVPESDLVIAITTNREHTNELTEAVIDFGLRTFADARVFPDTAMPSQPLPIDARRIVGRYTNHTFSVPVTVEQGEARLQLGSHAVDLGNQPAMRLHRVDDEVYRVLPAEHGVDLRFRFIDTDGDGVADFLWFSRMLRREEGPAT